MSALSCGCRRSECLQCTLPHRGNSHSCYFQFGDMAKSARLGIGRGCDTRNVQLANHSQLSQAECRPIQRAPRSCHRELPEHLLLARARRVSRSGLVPGRLVPVAWHGSYVPDRTTKPHACWFDCVARFDATPPATASEFMECLANFRSQGIARGEEAHIGSLSSSASSAQRLVRRVPHTPTGRTHRADGCEPSTKFAQVARGTPNGTIASHPSQRLKIVLLMVTTSRTVQTVGQNLIERRCCQPCRVQGWQLQLSARVAVRRSHCKAVTEWKLHPLQSRVRSGHQTSIAKSVLVEILSNFYQI